MTLASSRARLCRLLACALMLAVSTPLKAQNPSSAIADLLQSAKDALNDLRFARADTIAREILGRASLRRSQTVLATGRGISAKRKCCPPAGNSAL